MIDLVGIVTDAHRRGFCRWRVATALGASEQELALIDDQITAGAGGERQELVDVGQLITGRHGLSSADPR